MENLKHYFGSLAEAYEAGEYDDDQYVILDIIDYRGSPETRSEMEFYVRFEKYDTTQYGYDTTQIWHHPRLCRIMFQYIESWNR